MKRKPNKVVTVLINDSHAELVGEHSLRGRIERIDLKEFKRRLFENRHSAIHPCIRRMFRDCGQRERDQGRQTASLFTGSAQC
jgi:hypothetical protein